VEKIFRRLIILREKLTRSEKTTQKEMAIAARARINGKAEMQRVWLSQTVANRIDRYSGKTLTRMVGLLDRFEQDYATDSDVWLTYDWDLVKYGLCGIVCRGKYPVNYAAYRPHKYAERVYRAYKNKIEECAIICNNRHICSSIAELRPEWLSPADVELFERVVEMKATGNADD